MDIPTHPELVEQIDLFLSRHGMAPSRFGREVTGEPNLVSSIREGREPSLGTLRKLVAFMDERDTQAREGGVLLGIDSQAKQPGRPAHRLNPAGA